jgi:hypothetical protein
VKVELIAGPSRRNATLHARCGVTDDKLIALEIIENDKAC